MDNILGIKKLVIGLLSKLVFLFKEIKIWICFDLYLPVIFNRIF